MNPDIQRIAEKWLDDFLGDCRLTFGMDETEKCLLLERFQEALTELSALRDTQERGLREKVEALSQVIESQKQTSDAILKKLEAANLEADTARGERDSKATQLACLRAELARRDEVEKELREKLEQTENMATEDVAYQNTHILQKDQLIASLRSRIGELEKVSKIYEPA